MRISQALFGVVVVSFIVERIVEQLSQFFPKRSRKKALWAIGSALGIIICYGIKIGVLSQMDLVPDPSPTWVHWLDYLLTGLLIGGGTEPIHSLIVGLERKKEEWEARAEKAKRDAGNLGG